MTTDLPVPARLTKLAWSVADKLDESPLKCPVTAPLRAVARHADTEVVLTLQPCGWESAADDERAPMLLPFFLSPLERQVLQLVALAGRPIKGSAIGARTGNADDRRQANTRLRGVLANLCERGILESGDDGYRLADEFASLAPTVLPQDQGDDPP